MADQSKLTFDEELEQYEYVQFVVPDHYNIPRGKMVTGKFKQKYAQEGTEYFLAICLFGPDCQIPSSLFDVIGPNVPNGELKACRDTLTCWPWVSRQNRRVGNILCDMYLHDGSPDPVSPRQLLKKQLNTLWYKHGLIFRSAFEYVFTVYKKGTLQPLGGHHRWCYNMRAWGHQQDLFCELTDTLRQMDIEVRSILPDLCHGMWEISVEPEDGVRGGDLGFYVKNAVKGVFEQHGYTATFMAHPIADPIGTPMHMNHSLWSQGDSEGGRRSVMLDEDDPHKMSKTARHWLAGLVAHTPALTALCCPTVNCYHRLFKLMAPSDSSWGVDDRRTTYRLHNANSNVFIENRLPSGACCTYLALAAVIAAGLDGLDRLLELPMEADPSAEQLPKTLGQALDALDKDSHMRTHLGDRFVDAYIVSKRENEVQPYEAVKFSSLEEQFQFERDMYMDNL